jgi:hypothetical protein
MSLFCIYRPSSLKQQSTDKRVAIPENTILTTNQSLLIDSYLECLEGK